MYIKLEHDRLWKYWVYAASGRCIACGGRKTKMAAILTIIDRIDCAQRMGISR